MPTIACPRVARHAARTLSTGPSRGSTGSTVRGSAGSRRALIHRPAADARITPRIITPTPVAVGAPPARPNITSAAMPVSARPGSTASMLSSATSTVASASGTSRRNGATMAPKSLVPPRDAWIAASMAPVWIGHCSATPSTMFTSTTGAQSMM